MPTEADTCRTLITPKLQAAGWDIDPHSIAEQRTFTDGRIVVTGDQARRRPAKRADYLLRYTRDLPIAVVEAKAETEAAATGIQQAKEYAAILDLQFAYATNGRRIIEFDSHTGLERNLTAFPTPDELWSRLRKSRGLAPVDLADRFLAPAHHEPDRPLRYYQRIAVERTVRNILQGNRRLLLTMATGTGKTDVAFQICWKLWSARWNAKNDPTRKPRILYLADRTFLIDDPKDKRFAPFGDARHKIEGGEAITSREMYFATYQSIARDERRPGLYREYAPDFFDLIIVDECHRGSARDESSWREILTYFTPAYQLGMTATPLREENRDTYLYFGNPIYTYTLRQGIEDGFLAPYRVHRIVTQWDAAGWRPSKEDLDRFKRRIPDEQYGTADFEKKIALLKRTETIAAHLTAYLKRTDRFAKTIVFCVDQEHASDMRTALNNLNADLVQDYPNYVCRVTADEGGTGRGHMQKFQDVETDARSPIILTTSQLLTTGLDAPTCRNVVLVRLVNSMVEFKQIIGRGTRVREDYGKRWFTILDYTGTATRNFADPKFDGEAALATQEEIDGYGKTLATTVETPEESDTETPVANEPAPIDPPPADPAQSGALPNSVLTPSVLDPNDPALLPRKFYFDGGLNVVIAEIIHELDADGKQLRAVRLTDYTAERVRALSSSPEDLRAKWIDADERARIIEHLGDRGIDFPTLAAQVGKPDADPFDLLCHLAWNGPILTRRQRAERVRKEEKAFFEYFQPEAREILEELLEKYAEDGELEFRLPEVLKVPPISRHGNVGEIAEKLGGSAKIERAITSLFTALYPLRKA